MNKVEDLEELLVPGNGRLRRNEEGGLEATIVDMELDPIECAFNKDDCVLIDTKDLAYVALHKDNLKRLIELIEEAQDEYAMEDKESMELE